MPSFGLHRWLTTGNASQVCEASNSLPCWGKVMPLTGFADGSINTVPVTDPIPPGAPRTLSVRTFGEAAINLTDSGILDPNVCTGFGSAYLKSRSSDSFTAALKDFIAPIPVEIDNCQPWTVDVLKVDSGGNPLAGAQFQLWRDVNNNGVLDAGDTQFDGTLTTGASGTVSWTIPASSTFDGQYIVHESAAPPGYSPAADQVFSVTIGNTAQTVSFTFTNSPLPGTINIHKQDDGGNPVSGVTFTLFKDAAPTGGTPGPEDTAVQGSCTTNGGGDCSITQVPLGPYWLDETLPAGSPYSKDPAYPKAVTVGLGSGNQGQTLTFTATNPRLHRVITLVCHEGTDTLDDSVVTLDGATKTSIGTVPAALAAKGVTAADLCTLGGAQFNGKEHGTYAGSVVIAP